MALGFLDDTLDLTSSGRALLRAAPKSEEERRIWRKALLAMTLEDEDGSASHPVLVLLRLTGERAIYHREGTELALPVG